ncbi:MAG TPA: hypothetical protein VFS93_07225, partial [Terrimesophilobacter sp.]|nr:hypothetical protein [Terrimesophilobacter sp.]
FALAGCATTVPGASEGSEPGADAPASDSPASDTGCLIDKTWQLDVEDMAAQLLTQMQNTGMPVVAVSGFGTQELQLAEEGLATNSVDVTFELTVAPADAPTSITQLRQFGSAYGDWAWVAASDRVEFSNWETDVKLEMTIEIGGVVTTLPTTDLPLTDSSGSDMSVTCAGERLETRPEGSPFVQRWNAGT